MLMLITYLSRNVKRDGGLLLGTRATTGTGLIFLLCSTLVTGRPCQLKLKLFLAVWMSGLGNRPFYLVNVY